jgi:hypothetical protein
MGGLPLGGEFGSVSLWWIPLSGEPFQPYILSDILWVVFWYPKACNFGGELTIFYFLYFECLHISLYIPQPFLIIPG